MNEHVRAYPTHSGKDSQSSEYVTYCLLPIECVALKLISSSLFTAIPSTADSLDELKQLNLQILLEGDFVNREQVIAFGVKGDRHLRATAVENSQSYLRHGTFCAEFPLFGAVHCTCILISVHLNFCQTMGALNEHHPSTYHK